MNLEGSKTQANLMAAFAGECQARTKYTYYAEKAKQDGFVQISNLFLETANNEKEHAEIWFKLLHGFEHFQIVSPSRLNTRPFSTFSRSFK